MPNAHRVVLVLAGIGLICVSLLVAMPLLSVRLPPGMYEKSYQFQNKAANALVRIIPVAEVCAILVIFVAASHSRGAIFREDRWLLPVVGVILVAASIGCWFALKW